MIRPRNWFVSIFLLSIIAPGAPAQDKKPAAPPQAPPPQWVIDRTLQVSPRAPAVPALKYRLLPLESELKAGNAVPIYLRLVHEQNDAARKYWIEAPTAWNELPLDKFPVDKAKQFLESHKRLLEQIEFGTRRKTAEWNYTLDDEKPIQILLPDAQAMRSYAPMLVLQARLALAEGDFTSSARHLRTGFAFSRHVSEAPFLINSLVGIAIARHFTNALGDFIERPGAPNLYWSLVELPRPLIDMRRQYAQEYKTAEGQFPELTQLDRDRTAEQWDSTLRQLRLEVAAVVPELEMVEGVAGPNSKPQANPPPQAVRFASYFPKDCRPGDPAAKSPDLPSARQFVAKTKGLSNEKVEAMPAAQVLLLYIYGTYQEDRDDLYKGFNLPYPQAFIELHKADKRLHDRPTSEGHALGRLLLSALAKPLAAQARLERQLAMLRLVEALRIYAAAHNGRLPDKLDDVKEVPIPVDPSAELPFEYSLEGGTATLVSKAPHNTRADDQIRYRVSVRKE